MGFGAMTDIPWLTPLLAQGLQNLHGSRNPSIALAPSAYDRGSMARTSERILVARVAFVLLPSAMFSADSVSEPLGSLRRIASDGGGSFWNASEDSARSPPPGEQTLR